MWFLKALIKIIFKNEENDFLIPKCWSPLSIPPNSPHHHFFQIIPYKQTNKKVFDFPYKYTIAKSVIKNICVYKTIPCRLQERDGKTVGG